MAVSAEVATLFLEELARRNIAVRVGDGGGYEIDLDGLKQTISLENLSRDFARDRDPGMVARFVDTVTAGVRVPDWEAARPRIRWALEPTDMPLDHALHDLVSDQVALVLVHVSADEMQVMWVSESLAAGWGQTKEAVFDAATENMQRLLAEATVTFEPVESHKLGMLNTECVAFKAALVLCPGLRELAEPVLGWPLLAVMPCRDFVYLIPDADRDILGRVGAVVVREYADGAYPLCTEVFELTDTGARAIGAFQKPEAEDEEPEEDADGMKTVRYRGGTVVFRIPAHWEEEYEEEGGGTFYDEDLDAGTFRLSTILAQSKDPVTTHLARDMAEKYARREGGAVSELPGGNWLTEYTITTEESESEDALTIRYWVVTNPVPPNHIRVALFSYTVRTELLDDGDVADELHTLAREVRAATFAAEVGE